MKSKYPVVIIALFVLIVGVSCRNELTALECNLNARAIGLETEGVTFQYYVEKNSGPNGGKICGWIDFDISSGFTVINLMQGAYTFSVRGVSQKDTSKVIYFGSETCLLLAESNNEINITLYPQYDASSPKSTLSVFSAVSDNTNRTASIVYENCETKVSGKAEMLNVGTGFSSTLSLPPGYYRVSVFVYQEGVIVGGNSECVFVPLSYDKELSVHVYPRSISNIVDIGKTSTLNLNKGDKKTLAWVGEAGSSSNGYWMIGNKVVEDNAYYISLPTDETGEYTVEYHNGTVVKTCKVTITGGTKVSIMNFRSATSSNACIGYTYTATGASFGVPYEMVEDMTGVNINDYTTLGLTPVYGKLEGATFAEIYSIDKMTTSQYGSSPSVNNTTLKYLVVNGSISSDKIKGRLTALEKILIDKPNRIGIRGLENLTNLTTIYIIPSTKTGIESGALSGCTSLTKIYILGDSSMLSTGQVVLSSGWNNGTSLTESDVIFVSELPL